MTHPAGFQSCLPVCLSVCLSTPGTQRCSRLLPTHSDRANLRDSVARVLPRWDARMPGYTNLVGMYAFGCAENGGLERAEELAMRNLHMDPYDAWSVHCVAHILDHQCRRNEGLRFMREMQVCVCVLSVCVCA